MKTTLILILIVLIIGVLIGGFYVWNSHQKAGRQYKTCLDKCELSARPGLSKYLSIFDQSSEYLACVAECKETYAK